MRSAAAPVLVLLGLATAIVLGLLLVQISGLRGDLELTREEVAALVDEVDGLERGVPISELSMRLAELENDIREWVAAFGGEAPSRGTTTDAQIVERLDDVLDRIDALDARLDEICEGVPIC